jgi:hypothetical protein
MAIIISSSSSNHFKLTPTTYSTHLASIRADAS